MLVCRAVGLQMNGRKAPRRGRPGREPGTGGSTANRNGREVDGGVEALDGFWSCCGAVAQLCSGLQNSNMQVGSLHFFHFLVLLNL